MLNSSNRVFKQIICVYNYIKRDLGLFSASINTHNIILKECSDVPQASVTVIGNPVYILLSMK